MRAVYTIARNTFREAIRDRILYLFLGFAVLLIVSSKLFSMLTVGDETKIIKDLGLGAIQFFSMLISVMMSVMLVSREVENRTAFNILAKPVRRHSFILGKYFGLLAIIVANLLLMTAALLVIIFLYQGEIDLTIFTGAGMTFLEMAVLCAFAVLFAMVTKPILGSVLTLAVFVVGHMTQGIWLLTERLQDAVTRFIVAVVYYVLPNLERFNFKSELVHSLPIPAAAVWWAILYALIFTALALFLAWLKFREKDLL
ncbi:MAG TPA: ABC transporter permease [Acidobacteriota bacterium]|nr:ABC transporter permease [Acidobacteriota bacterium]